MGSPGSIDVEVVVGAPIDAVWRALVAPGPRRAWWPYLELEARPGGRLVERWRDAEGRAVMTSGEVLEVKAPKRLRATWRDEGWPAATEIELSLGSERGGTRFRVRHAGWDRLGEHGARLASEHADGWQMHLTNLRRHFEGKPRSR